MPFFLLPLHDGFFCRFPIGLYATRDQVKADEAAILSFKVWTNLDLFKASKHDSFSYSCSQKDPSKSYTFSVSLPSEAIDVNSNNETETKAIETVSFFHS